MITTTLERPLTHEELVEATNDGEIPLICQVYIDIGILAENLDCAQMDAMFQAVGEEFEDWGDNIKLTLVGVKEEPFKISKEVQGTGIFVLSVDVNDILDYDNEDVDEDSLISDIIAHDILSFAARMQIDYTED